MKPVSKFIYFIALIFCFSVYAQEASDEAPMSESTAVHNVTELKPKKRVTRSKLGLTSPPTESSSLIGDPDNLDPMLPNRDNIKEDNEPVLEGIRDLAGKSKKDADAEAAKKKEEELANKAKLEKVADDPDLELEKQFHRIYKRYNSNPTPADIWAAATSKQTAQEYVVQKGDTLWSISKILFGDANFWPKIWSLNKQGILNPHFIWPKTKIYFYMGDDANAPTLAVGEPAPGGVGSQALGGEIAGHAHGTQGADVESGYGEIPPSLPLSRNKGYFAAPKKEITTKIDFEEKPRFDFEALSDIFITDTPIKTDVKIQLSETSKLRCYEGRILRDIEYIGKLIEDYEIFEPLDTFKTTIGNMYAYRTYGSAKAYQNNKLKITDCTGIIATELVVIPKDKMYTLKNRKLSITRKPRVIGGLDVKNQNLYLGHQIAYIDFGHTQFSPGQEFKTMSQVTDQINGKFKIVRRFGSFAVAVFTEVDDLIEVGDKVIF